MSFRSRSIVVPEPPFDLTPMIDVVLLLIIFFTLTAQFARTQMRTPMELPKERGEAQPQGAGAANVVIDVDRQGEMSVTGGRVTLSEVESQLIRAKSQLGVLSVEVRAHRLAPARAINRLAGVLARSGVKEWSLGTAGEGGGAGGGT